MDSILKQASELYEKRYYKKAMELVLPGAGENKPDYQNLLGLCCMELKDSEAAAAWFEKAADLGYIPAMLNIADCYLTGTGVGQSPKNARFYLKQAAALGDSFAASQLEMLGEEDITPEKPKTQMEFFGDSTMEFSGTTLVKYSGKDTHVVVPPEVKVIGTAAFSGCKQLRSVELPDGLEQIGDQAFLNCEKLEAIHIPDSVTYIGGWAFQDCMALKEVLLPAGLQRLEVQAFRGTDSLKSVTIPGSLWKAVSGFEWSFLEEIKFMPGVEAISMDMFWGCSTLKRIIVPQTTKFVIQGPNSPKHHIEEIRYPCEAVPSTRPDSGTLLDLI